jgi:hypothetical protein
VNMGMYDDLLQAAGTSIGADRYIRAFSDPNGLPLQKVLRDLVALSAVPSVWLGRESRDIAADLADLLVTLLNLDFALVICAIPTAAPRPK